VLIENPIITYDATGLLAPWLFAALEYAGSDSVAIYDGGFTEW
jgi:3-mercaptopyruvate sulfurtransferase SseA